jgi:RNA polymerase sigma-70 factor (ECF subfamily)
MTAFEPAAVVHEHADFVWRVLRHLGVIEPQLEDLSQEVLLVVLRQLPGFQGRASLRTWIFGICRNVARRARSEGRLLRELPSALLPDNGAPATQDHELWLKQAHTQLVAILDTLDADQRSVFMLYELEELSMEEIATLLEAPVTTCYSRLAAARSRVEAGLRRGRLRAEFQLQKGGRR